MKSTKLLGLGLAVFAVSLTSCNNQTTEKTNDKMEIKKGITKAPFGTADGKEVALYTLTNANGEAVKISTYGGVVTSWGSTG